MEEQRKNEFPRPQETPDWAQETLAPAKPPFSAGRKEVLLEEKPDFVVEDEGWEKMFAWPEMCPAGMRP